MISEDDAHDLSFNCLMHGTHDPELPVNVMLKPVCAVYNLYPPASGTPIGISVWVCIFGACQVLLSLLRNFNSLRGISFLAAVMSLGYSITAFAVTMRNGR